MHFHMHIKPRYHQDAVTIHMPEEFADEQKRADILDKIKTALV